MTLRTPYRPAHKLARLIRLVTEIKADPYQSPATLLDTLIVGVYEDREKV